MRTLPRPASERPTCSTGSSPDRSASPRAAPAAAGVAEQESLEGCGELLARRVALLRILLERAEHDRAKSRREVRAVRDGVRGRLVEHLAHERGDRARDERRPAAEERVERRAETV